MRYDGTTLKRAPVRLEELDRAIQLLGALAKGQQIKQSLQMQLEQYMGHLPKNADVAQQWKMALKRHRKVMFTS